MASPPTAVLVSGGLDSAVLTAELAASGAEVTPIFIRTGLGWETIELAYLNRFLSAIARPTLKPLVLLDLPVTDLYGNHWSMNGAVPDSSAADEAFYLPGRNVILLSKALLWCRINEVKTLALGILGANPFPDATANFFERFAAVVGDATGGPLSIVTPYASLTKIEVVRRGQAFPLQHTLSCMAPVKGRHCGVCGKCGERGRAFRDAGVPDPTDSASTSWQHQEQVKLAAQKPWERANGAN
jgi:7-cyano-7-deazaguanine synthase